MIRIERVYCFEPGTGQYSCQQINPIGPNQATGMHSVAIGEDTIAKRSHEIAFGSIMFSVPSDNQRMDNVLAATALPGTSVPLTYDGGFSTLDMPLDSVWQYSIFGNGVGITSGLVLSYVVQGSIKNDAGIISLVGPPVVTINFTELATISLIVVATGSGLGMFANNGSAETCRFNARVQLVQLGFRNFVG